MWRKFGKRRIGAGWAGNAGGRIGVSPAIVAVAAYFRSAGRGFCRGFEGPSASVGKSLVFLDATLLN